MKAIVDRLASPTVRSAAATSVLRVALAGVLFLIQAACAAILDASVSDQVVAAMSTAMLVSSILAFGSADTVIRLSERRAEVVEQSMLAICVFGSLATVGAVIIRPGLTSVAFAAAVFSRPGPHA